MIESLVFAAMTAPLVVLAVVLYWVDRIRRREALYRWASDQGFHVLSARQPWLTEASGFPLAFSKSQHVFRVHVEAADGHRRSGWIRFGTVWLGLCATQADVRWDSL